MVINQAAYPGPCHLCGAITLCVVVDGPLDGLMCCTPCQYELLDEAQADTVAKQT